MLNIIIRKYHIKNTNKLKQAAFLLIKNIITEENIEEHKRNLLDIINDDNDVFIFILQQKENINILALRLIVAFKNSVDKKIGILCSPQTEELLSILELNNDFVVGVDARTIIRQIER